METHLPQKTYEEEMAEYTAFALEMPLEQARELVDIAGSFNPIFAEDTQELNQATQGE
jgi:hypothetical protein